MVSHTNFTSEKFWRDLKWEVSYFFRHPVAYIDKFLFPYKWYKKLRGYGDFNGFHWYELAEKWGINTDTTHIDEEFFVDDDNGVKHEDIFINGTIDMEMLDKSLEPNRKWLEELKKHKKRVLDETRKVIQNAAKALLTIDKQEKGKKIANDVRQYCRAMARDRYGASELWKAMAKLDDYNLLNYTYILLEHMWT